ncbi:MAG: type I citrate synthase [Gemmatimonas sp. SM23_52]|nr:MAG: type I citrate synthase [Gemmatimonas sp. SM23_52]
MSLQDKLAEKIEAWRPRTTKLLKDSQAIGGMRGVKCLVTDISYLDPNEGIRFRGYTIPETLAKLPKVPGAEMPYVEGHTWLLLTGEVPSKKEVEELAAEFRKRSEVPKYVFNMLRAMSPDTHPMTMFSAAILALQRDSVFVRQYQEGLDRYDYWKPTLEDALNLWAKLPQLGAFIYRLKYKGDKQIKPDPKLDFGGNFAHMMGIDKPYDDVARLYFILHSDHESGNVSAHAGHLIASALSDAYYASSGLINGLAGPLHGLANQEVLRWIQGVMEQMGGKIPTEEEMKQFVWDTLNSGQVIPGFGHAVLRKTDPRYTEQRNFCLKHLPDDPIFKYVDMLFKVVPPILQEQGKAKNPWPNVDAQSGALGYPIERPKSVTTAMLEDVAGIK